MTDGQGRLDVLVNKGDTIKVSASKTGMYSITDVVKKLGEKKGQRLIISLSEKLQVRQLKKDLL